MTLRNTATACVATVAVAGLFGMGAAHAQTSSAPVEKPFTIKLGALFPSDTDDTDTHASIGLAYEFGKTKSDSPIAYGIYADYLIQSSKSETFDDVTASLKTYGFGIGVSGRYLFSPTASVSPYAGLGLGVYDEHITGEVSADGDSASASDSKTSLGGKIMAGAEFKSGFLAEAVYQFFPSDDGVKLSGFGINVGYRF